jgi:hypothetical protein
MHNPFLLILTTNHPIALLDRVDSLPRLTSSYNPFPAQEKDYDDDGGNQSQQTQPKNPADPRPLPFLFLLALKP